MAAHVALEQVSMLGQIRNRKRSREERPRVRVLGVGEDRLVFFFQRWPITQGLYGKWVSTCCFLSARTGDTGDGSARGAGGLESAAGASVATVRRSLGTSRARKKSCPVFVRHCTHCTETNRLMMVLAFASLLTRKPRGANGFSAMFGPRTSATAKRTWIRGAQPGIPLQALDRSLRSKTRRTNVGDHSTVNVQTRASRNNPSAVRICKSLRSCYAR